MLAKLLVINSGSRLFDAFSSKPLDELNVTDETRDEIRHAVFVTPLPEVTRVIFVATPQRGSYVAGGSLAQLVARLVRLPLNQVRIFADLLTDNSDALRISPDNVRIGSQLGLL